MFLSPILYSLFLPLVLASGNVHAQYPAEKPVKAMKVVAIYAEKSVFINRILDVVPLRDEQIEMGGLYYKEYRSDRFAIQERFGNQVSEESREQMKEELRLGARLFRSNVLALLDERQLDIVKEAGILDPQ